MTFKVGYIIGSLAKESKNRKFVEALIKLAPEELELVEIPIKDLPVYTYDYDPDYPPAGRAFKKALSEVDALLWSTPEYNRAISAATKNAIEWASHPYGQNELGKPTAVVSVSYGAIGGAVAQAQLRSILTSAGADVLGGTEIYINFGAGVVEDDHISDKSAEFLAEFWEKFANFLKKQLG